MLICTHCGKTYEGRLPTYTEIHGYTSLGNVVGEVCYDNECPFCHNGELVVATECKVCGAHFYDEENLKVCEDCLEANRTLEVALAIGDENETDVYINGFIKTLLGDAKIKEILLNHVKENFTTSLIKSTIAKYTDEDKQYFAEWVEYEAEHKE